MATLGSPHGGSSDGFTAFGVDVSTGLEEVSAQLIAVVYSGPLGTRGLVRGKI